MKRKRRQALARQLALLADRARRGRRSSDLARDLGVSESVVSQLLAERANPTLKTLDPLLRANGIDLGKVMAEVLAK